MRFTDSFRELFTSVLERVGLAWWVKIRTTRPACEYYFGPFATRQEAVMAQPGYLEDLLGAGLTNFPGDPLRLFPQ